MTSLVCGAGGMIGGALVEKLVASGEEVYAVDIKDFDDWYRYNDQAFSCVLDLSDTQNCLDVVHDSQPNDVYMLAADMGGIGFIEHHKLDCMMSVLISAGMLKAALDGEVSRYLYTSSACFMAGAPVLTRDGVKPIEDVVVGDEVLTHRGRWREVIETTANPYFGEVVTVRPTGRPPLTVTADHRLLDGNGEWIEAGEASWGVTAAIPESNGGSFDLGPVDRLVAAFQTVMSRGERSLNSIAEEFSLSPNTVTKMGSGIFPGRCDPVGVESVSLSWDLGWLMGLWLAEGWIESNKKGGQRRIVFAFDDGEEILVEGIRRVLFHYFDIPMDRVVVYDVSGQRGFKVHVTSDRLALLMESCFYPDGECGAIMKTLRRPILDASPEFLEGLISGWWTGDGSSQASPGRKTRWLWSTSSWALAHAGRAVLDSLGVSTSMQVRAASTSTIDGRVIYGKESYHIYSIGAGSDIAADILAGRSSKMSPLPDPIKLIVSDPVEVVTSVYNLHVADDHSYVVGGIVAHNCVYAAGAQNSTDLPALTEDMAYPAEPEPGYGEEKLFSESLVLQAGQESDMLTYAPRLHNVYSTHCTWEGGREKAPAAICRKVAEAVITGRHEIDIWGDGNQTRSFMWIDDCLEGFERIINSDYHGPLNLGSSELVTVNELVSIVEDIAGVTLERTYDLSAPIGVMGRNSDNTLIQEKLGWEPSTSLRSGLERLYGWVYKQVELST